MSNIVIKVDFLAGTTITSAVKEAIMKAGQWDVAIVEFSFNGKHISVNRNSDVEDIVGEYLAQENESSI